MRARRLIFEFHIESGSLTASKNTKATLHSRPHQWSSKGGRLNDPLLRHSHTLCGELFPSSVLTRLWCRQGLESRELLDVYCLQKAVELSPHLLQIVSSLCWRWRGLRLPDTEWEDRVQTIHFSILKVTWHLFVGEDVVEFWQMSAFLPGCCRKHIWKAWLMFPNNHRLLLIWWKIKVCVFTCWLQGLLAISFKMM